MLEDFAFETFNNQLSYFPEYLCLRCDPQEDIMGFKYNMIIKWLFQSHQEEEYYVPPLPLQPLTDVINLFRKHTKERIIENSHICRDMVLDSLSKELNAQDIEAFIDTAVSLSNKSPRYVSNNNKIPFQKLQPYGMFSADIATALIKILRKKAIQFKVIETLSKNPINEDNNINFSLSIPISEALSGDPYMSAFNPHASVSFRNPFSGKKSENQEMFSSMVEKTPLESKTEQESSIGDNIKKHTRLEWINSPPVSLLLVFQLIENILYENGMDVINSLLEIHDCRDYLILLVKLLFRRELSYFTIQDIYQIAIDNAKNHGRSILSTEDLLAALGALNFDIDYYKNKSKHSLINYLSSDIIETGKENSDLEYMIEIRIIVMKRVLSIIYNESMALIKSMDQGCGIDKREICKQMSDIYKNQEDILISRNYKEKKEEPKSVKNNSGRSRSCAIS